MFKHAAATQTKVLFEDSLKPSEILEFPLSGFTAAEGFDFSHVIGIEVDLDPEKGSAFRITRLGTTGPIIPILVPGIPTLSKWAMIMLVVLLALSGLATVRRNRLQE
jgi:hypothetical protein